MSIEPTAILVVAQLVEKLVRAARIRIGLGPFGNIDVRLSTPFTPESIDARLEKIETARQSLTEALWTVIARESALKSRYRSISISMSIWKNLDS